MGKRLRVSPYRRPYAATPERPGAYVTICDQINTAGRPGRTAAREPGFARPPPPGKPAGPAVPTAARRRAPARTDPDHAARREPAGPGPDARAGREPAA